MAIWNKTANELAERRNSFLRDLGHVGMDVTYRVMTTVGGTWDNVQDALVGGTQQPQDTLFPKSGLLVPIKQMDDSGEGMRMNQKMVVAGGRKMAGVDITTMAIIRFNVNIPLSFDAIYLIGNAALGLQQYHLDAIINTVAIGPLPLWNEVRMVKF